MFDLTNPIFSDEEAAREHLEAQRWPEGAFCPFCKKQETVHALPAESMMSKPSKKNPISMSAHQLGRMLGLQYKSAWFLEMRIREAMTPSEDQSGPIGGDNLVVESDETYIGGKAAKAHKNKPIPKKHAVVTLVEREGEVRAKDVPNVTAKNVREHLSASVDKSRTS